MNSINFIIFLKKKWTICIIFLFFILIALGVAIIQPFKYKAESKVLIVQNSSSGIDPYALSQTSSYLSIILSEIITTNSFYEEVVKSNNLVDVSYFKSEYGAAKKWKKVIAAKSIGDSGIIEISVKHPNKVQVKEISNTVLNVLMKKHLLFHGGGDNITIKTIDPPVLFVASPNLTLNIAIALVASFVTSFAYISYLSLRTSFDKQSPNYF